MRRLLLALGLTLGLAGCAGNVESLFGHTTAGTGMTNSEHVPGNPCPNFNAQGSAQVNKMTAFCVGPDGHMEVFTVDSVDPQKALEAALASQTQVVNNLIDKVTQLLALIPKPIP